MKIFRYFFVFFVLLQIANRTFAQQPLSGNPLSRVFGGGLLVFEPNFGQSDTEARFLSHGPGYTVSLAANQVVLSVSKKGAASGPKVTKNEAGIERISLQLVGGNPTSEIVGLDELPGKSNYFIGGNSANWRTSIPQYSKVEYKSIYHGIDVVYYGHQGTLEYDFVVASGTDPNVIRLRVQGSKRVEIDDEGNLALSLGSGLIQIQKPTLYQEVRGRRQSIDGRFVMLGQNEVGILPGSYDRRKTLVIDPVLSYATLIGTNNDTQAQGIAIDPKGNIYIAGTTFATNYPTVKAYQSTNKGTRNVFITKLNPTGNQILYSTYLGGSGFDDGRAIAVDAEGNAYVTGNPQSGDFPTTPGAFMTTCTEPCNTPFVTKLLADGSMGFSTFMGGTNIAAWSISVDSNGASYITGNAASNDLPLVNPFQTTPAGGFVQKLNSTGSALDYSTYLGGGGDWGRAITVDAAGSAYVVGSTSASNFPIKNPIQFSNLENGGTNAFITKFSPDGSSLDYSTYLGGSLAYTGDAATGVAVDTNGNIHITGTSTTCDFPLMIGALNTECDGNDNYDSKVFVVTLNPTGNQMLSSTFLGSGIATGIAVDASGNSYVAGSTSSPSFPILNGLENSTQGESSFITELDVAGKILFSTYLGGQVGSSTGGIAVSQKGAINLTGYASVGFPIVRPIPSQKYAPCCYTIFVATISPKNIPQFSLSPRVSPVLSLRNESSVTLNLTNIAASANFALGGNCGTSLAPGTGCTLILAGAADNKKTGTVTISSNASKIPEKFVIEKSPTGDGVGPIVTASPILLNYTPQLIGTTSSAKTVIVSNVGVQAAAINNISAFGDFRQTNDCPGVLAPNSYCAISVVYTPSSAGSGNSQLDIVHDPNQTSTTVGLNGVGSGSAINLSTWRTNFGTQFTGLESLSRIVNVINASPYTTSAPNISASAGFVQTNTCTAALASGASCRVAVTFVPTTNQNAVGTLKISNFGPGGTQNVGLYGTGLITADLSVSPITVDFPINIVGYSDGQYQITVTNISQNSVSIQSIQASAPFTETNNCPPTLGPNGNCQVEVSVTPQQVGQFSGNLTVNFSGKGSPQIVGLTAAAETRIQFSPSPVNFGQQTIGIAGGPMYPVVENIGAQTTVTLNSITIQGKEFKLVKNACGQQLAPFAGCILEVIFTPAGTGPRTGTITVVASDSSQPHVEQLQGFGIGTGQASLSASSLTFAPQPVNTTSPAQDVKLTNTGSGKLNLSSITASQFFSVTNNCGVSITAGASCILSVQFSPSLQGMLSGNITISDDVAGTPQSVTLNGVGQ